MAEALAVVGIVANIVQLVEFGSRVLKRLEEYQSKVEDFPEVFRHIIAELPVLLDALQQTQSAIDAGSMGEKSKRVLLPALEGCKVQIRQLDELIAKALPTSSDSWIRRGRKAFGSFRYDARVGRITAVIRGYVQTLTYHAAVSMRPLAGISLLANTIDGLVLTIYFQTNPHPVPFRPPLFHSGAIHTSWTVKSFQR
jgi:hypothetical protein